MCKAFRCIVDIDEKVTWKFEVDSHSELVKLGGYADKQLGEFAKIEITPRNGNYHDPDIWDYHVDESPAPEWCGSERKSCVFRRIQSGSRNSTRYSSVNRLSILSIYPSEGNRHSHSVA